MARRVGYISVAVKNIGGQCHPPQGVAFAGCLENEVSPTRGSYRISSKRARYTVFVRDDFSVSVQRLLARRAGHLCSNPDCRRATSGPTAAVDGSVNIGVGAHITAAAPGGPRYDPNLTREQRSAASNGIWLCQTCSKLIDSDLTKYTKELILNWKSIAEQWARSLIETPERHAGDTGPVLVLPSTDAAVSLLAFSARTTALLGRDGEQRELGAFLDSDSKFAWWLITGSAGTGKSRLALEVCHAKRPTWNAGFWGRADRFDDWAHFRPTRPTLIVVDYVASRVSFASEMVLQLAQASAYLPNPVRVLLLERDQGTWWSKFLREDSQSESALIIECSHGKPIKLPGLSPEQLLSLASSIYKARGIPWTGAIQREFKSHMRTLDPLHRPLFGMMAAAYAENTTTDSVADITLLRQVLRREAARRREAVADDERLRKLENLMVLATLSGGLLPRSDGFRFLAHTDIASLIPDPDLVDEQLYLELAAASGIERSLPGLQPDVLGERLVLDRVVSGPASANSFRRLLVTAWSLQADDVCDFIIRAASDFPEDAALDTLCDLPLGHAGTHARWARLVADIVRVSKRSDSALSQRLLTKLRNLADSRPDDAELSQECARAELYLGNILFFAEDDYAAASAQYEATIARAGEQSEMAASAVNNRGILHNAAMKEDAAFDDWTAVIEQATVSDEARACSLNNRADIFARRGEYDKAIADRSAVLALKDTSPDRRYIALVRRSRSYQQAGKTDEALRDLASILATDDISPHQKSEAQIERGIILMGENRLGDARQDFDTAIMSDELFPGTAERALVGLAELARRERDAERVHEHLSAATASPEIRKHTTIDAMIVAARLLQDQGKVEEANGLWQNIASDARSDAQQRSVAENRGLGEHPNRQ